MYKIVRLYSWPNEVTRDGHLRMEKSTIKKGLTLEQAQAHCSDPETSSKTATGAAARRITKAHGGADWSDGYEET